jgi:hypothetical protein
LKKCISIVFIILFLLTAFSGEVLALSYDANKYYWDCESMVGPVEDCLKERWIPLNYYPLISIGVLVVISCFIFSYRKRRRLK